ncbi:MAG: primosomal protein N' [Deltaproteobacteria bacterium]|nr:primosomal protein N' [Deltaproteobacteria bacterium]MBW2052361.1 primosomal protein N' [Deltaproteobacteria bacterium]MBW2140846.1 primosomal protein N' [Deltaproteobacteria bacterium]MBW2323990.1 primosomal protein N' [Deltaproteobacteria bacterium]
MSPSSCSLAEVAVALPAPGTFHYVIPDELTPFLEPGSRVLVPFGSRQVTGYVLNFLPPDHLHETGFKLKEILERLDDEPLFGPDLIPLFRFTADYYHYPLGQVIAEALPAGLKVMSWRMAVITPAGHQALTHRDASPEETRILETLVKSKGLALSRLAKDKREPLKVIRRLEARGWVEFETRLQKDRVRPRTERWLFPIPDKPDDPAVRLGSREKELLELLFDLGPLPIADLRTRFPSINQIARRLQTKGRLDIRVKELYRDSLGRALYFDPIAHEPTAEQAKAIKALTKAIKNRQYKPFLLHGVTGSGKTEVYLKAVAETFKQGRTALFIVPEISLTPAMEGLLKARFNEDVGVIHSGLSEGERYDQWLKICRKQVRLVLGARSAIFSPLENLGLIVVDEEHDGAYKQEDKLRYQARDLAMVRASQTGGVVILGSATPSLESYNHAQTGRYNLLTLKNRIGQDRLPDVEVMDLRTGSRRARGALTPELKRALDEVLNRGEQALLFLNRRGLAPLPMCLSCGHVIKCVNCSVSLTLHQGSNGPGSNNELVCHYCGFAIPQPQKCPACGSKAFRFIGVGTERLEDEIKKRFPTARVGRLDADTARIKGSLPKILQKLRQGELDILIGTQMITKGHDFPNITLVGVIEADLGLHLPDFRAGERTFQLLAQVAGRTGRGESPGRVIIQTLSPEHYSLLRAQKHDYEGFYQEELVQREILRYPPYARLALARFQGNSEAVTRNLAEEAAHLARKLLKLQSAAWLKIVGPAPAPVSRVKGKFRFQILIQSQRVKPLRVFLESWLDQTRSLLKGKGVSLSLDVDPYQVM